MTPPLPAARTIPHRTHSRAAAYGYFLPLHPFQRVFLRPPLSLEPRTSAGKEIRQLNAFIVAEVRKREEKNRSLREAAGRTVIGAKKLRETPIGTHYIPNRKGRRMRVHCKDVKLRKEVLADLRAMVEKRDEVRELRRKGDYSRRYPIGMFPPYEFRLAEYIRTPW